MIRTTVQYHDVVMSHDHALQSSRASPSSSVLSPVYSLERVLSETRLLWSDDHDHEISYIYIYMYVI